MILFEKTASFNMQESHKSEKKAEGGKKKIIKKALFEQTRGIIQSNDENFLSRTTCSSSP